MNMEAAAKYVISISIIGQSFLNALWPISAMLMPGMLKPQNTHIRWYFWVFHHSRHVSKLPSAQIHLRVTIILMYSSSVGARQRSFTCSYDTPLEVLVLGDADWCIT